MFLSAKAEGDVLSGLHRKGLIAIKRPASVRVDEHRARSALSHVGRLDDATQYSGSNMGSHRDDDEAEHRHDDERLAQWKHKRKRQGEGGEGEGDDQASTRRRRTREPQPVDAKPEGEQRQRDDEGEAGHSPGRAHLPLQEERREERDEGEDECSPRAPRFLHVRQNTDGALSLGQSGNPGSFPWEEKIPKHSRRAVSWGGRNKK